MIRPSARRVIAAALVATASGAAGCVPCDTGGESVMRWSSSSRARTRLAASGSKPGFFRAARPAYHRGEHSLLLGRNTSVRAFATRPWPEGSHGPAVFLLACCDEGTALALELQVPSETSPATEPTRHRTIVSASPQWAPHFVRFPGCRRSTASASWGSSPRIGRLSGRRHRAPRKRPRRLPVNRVTRARFSVRIEEGLGPRVRERRRLDQRRRPSTRTGRFVVKIRTKVRAGYCTDQENDDFRPLAPTPALIRR